MSEFYSYMPYTPDKVNVAFPLTKEQTHSMCIQRTCIWLRNSPVILRFPYYFRGMFSFWKSPRWSDLFHLWGSREPDFLGHRCREIRFIKTNTLTDLSGSLDFQLLLHSAQYLYQINIIFIYMVHGHSTRLLLAETDWMVTGTAASSHWMNNFQIKHKTFDVYFHEFGNNSCLHK